MSIDLLPCQITAADEWVAKGGKGYCISKVGHGKTFLAAECFRRSLEKYPAPALYITTKTALKEQAMKFKQFGLEGKVTLDILESLSNDKWEMIRRIPWGVIVIDEADKMTGSASKRNRRLLTLRPRHRLMLTGTELRNGLKDVFMPLCWLIDPPPYRNWTDFSTSELRHDNPLVPGQITGIRDEAKLAALMATVTFTMVNPDCPAELVAEEIIVEMSSEHRKVYEDLMETSVLEARTGTLLMSNAAVCNLRGRQLLQMPEALGLLLPSSKEAALLAKMKTLTGPSIVFTGFATVARILAKRHGWTLIEGSMSQKHRSDALASRPDVIVGTEAMSRGIDCPWVRNVHCLDSGFTSAVNRQRAGRATRYGGEAGARLFVYLCPRTVDYTSERKIVEKKLKQARKIYAAGNVSH